MKIDPNAPVFPHHGNGMFGEPVTHTPGMTYRQWLVGVIAQGMVSHPDTMGQCDVSSAKFNITGPQFLVQSAIEIADTIIAALNAGDSK